MPTGSSPLRARLVAAVSSLTGEHGWSPAAVVTIASGILIAAGIWWAYFLIPSTVLMMVAAPVGGRMSGRARSVACLRGAGVPRTDLVVPPQRREHSGAPHRMRT